MIVVDKYIGHGKDEINLANIIEQVEKERGQVIEITINSCGGDLKEAINIYNYLMSVGKDITTISEVICASAASVIFLAGDTRIARCPIMIHNPKLDGISGDKADLLYYADYVSKIEDELELIYEARSNQSKANISMLMDTETYISPSQAVSMGFATKCDLLVYAKIEIPIEIKNKKEEEEIKNQNEENMSENKDAKVNNLVLMDNNDPNKTLSLTKTEGAPEVGDEATPDGTYSIGEYTVVVENGIVASVTAENSEVVVSNDLDSIDPEYAELIAENTELKSRIADLEEQLARAKVLDPEEIRVLNAIKMAGGAAKVLNSISSKHSVVTRTQPQVSNALDSQKSYLEQQKNSIKNRK